MVLMLSVTAIYSHDWNSVREYDRAETHLVRNAPADHGLVLGYDNVDGLIQQVETLLTIDPDHPCLESLEIHAHGNPIAVDNLSRTDAHTWGQKLMTLNWCDEASIYLSGCNTGLARPRGPANTRGPIAKLLADAMPFDSSNFFHHITVNGSVGYLRGTRATGDASTTKGYTTGYLWWKTVWEEYPGAQDASGSQVWNAFRNW